MSEANDIDEFAGIAPAPQRRSPVLALVIVGLSVGTLVQLRGELHYALSPRAPAALEVLRGAGEPAIERYVRVRGVPDRSNSLFVEARGDKTRESFFRLLGPGPIVFVRARDTAGRGDLASTWTGRLRRFADAPFAASLRDYFGRAAQVTRALDLEALRAKLGASVAGPIDLRDRRGGTVTVTPTTELEIVEAPPEYALLLSRDKFPNAADAQREIDRVLAPLGGPAARHVDDAPDAFVFTVPSEPDAARRNALFAVLERAGVDLEPRLRVHRAPLERMRYGKTEAGEPIWALTLPGPHGAEVVPWAHVTEARLREPLRIDDDALVLVEGESPAGLLWAPVVAALLLALAAFNVWYLLRPRRVAD